MFQRTQKNNVKRNVTTSCFNEHVNTLVKEDTEIRWKFKNLPELLPHSGFYREEIDFASGSGQA